MGKSNISKQYLQIRENVLHYTNVDMNLKLETDNQVYIAVFDIPVKSRIVGMNLQTLALVFGLNIHIYFANGDAWTGLEKNQNVMKAMQSLLISSHQVLSKMQLTNTPQFYESENIRAYLKTRKGIYFKELIGNCKEDKFLQMLLNNLQKEISIAIQKRQ